MSVFNKQHNISCLTKYPYNTPKGGITKMKKELLSVSKQLKTLESKIGKIIKTLEKSEKSKAGKKPAAKKKTAAKKKKVVKKTTPKKKTAEAPTAYSTILGIIRRSKTGVNTAHLKAKTKFDDKKIANLIYKAKKQGKIKSVSKGVYKKA